MTILHLIAGPTGAGKTTYAIALAERIGAVRFSIDEWMAALFWPDAEPGQDFGWAIERVNRCEAVIAATALQVLARGAPVVLDLGFSRAEHRRKFIRVGAEAGFAAETHLVTADPETRWARVGQRNRDQGETFRFEVTREMFDFMEGMWEPPTPDEGAALTA
jgi:predicted kinase